MILFFVLSIVKLREDASIFTSSLVSLYSAYLAWSAMASIPDDTCNPFINSNANTIA